MKYRKRKNGFTLIELLVVVAIIGVLASLLMVNFVGIRQRGRDGQRKSNLKQIQSALELYRTDNDTYPASSDYPACDISLKSKDGTLTYMQKMPCDPLSGGSYTYSPTLTTYTLIACIENGNDPQKDAVNTAPCDGATNFSFTVQNP